MHALADPALAMPEGLAFESPVSDRLLELPTQPDQPVIQLRLPPIGDPRDALDQGADLIVTHDPSLLEYAAGRPDFVIHQLPWSRTYVVVQPGSAPPLTAETIQLEPQSLAEAVEADARVAHPPFWWLEVSCPARDTSLAPVTSQRIVYLRDDDVARGLAERLVALAVPGNGVRAAGLETSELLVALHEGSELAYIISLPKHAAQPCRELKDFPPGASIRPLIDTRAHAIVRRGAPPLAVDWDGTIRVVRP
ncbi:MAG TPA: hypothetical protein VD930_00505 [Gemmatimonadales bacterium]|nr:hypothetical protein [Gemmatimonadales bacterium]